jgi:3-hydroxy-9,10-secoandrosta-1,3,5(10)-triene-9,17-dione monooxygenase reductase component
MPDQAARDFRTALGSFVTGVTIVTTRDAAGRDVGLTANSFNSVSLDPPMILWSLALSSSNLRAFRTAPWWAVHVLASEQEALSARFASRDVEKFAGIAVGRGPGDIPLLQGCAARFICRTAFEYEGGDHAIFVGEVQSFDRAGHPPLIYHQGRYGRVLADTPDAAAALRDATARGLIIDHDGQMRLSDSGAALLVELLAVAEAAPTRLAAKLTPAERTMLRRLLERVTEERPGALPLDPVGA